MYSLLYLLLFLLQPHPLAPAMISSLSMAAIVESLINASEAILGKIKVTGRWQ